MTQPKPLEERVREMNREADPQAENASGSAARGALRGMSYEDGQAALSPEQGGGGTFLHELFVRMDRNKDHGINRDEVKDHLKMVGVNGFFGGMIRNAAADKMIEELDLNKDEMVSWDEFHGVAKSVLPADVFDEEGNVRTDLVEEVYAIMDRDGSGGVTGEELYEATLDNLPEGTSHASKIADVGKKLGMDALDFDKDGVLTKDEILKAAHDIARVMGS